MLHIPDIHLDIKQTQFYKDFYNEFYDEVRAKIENEIKLKEEIEVEIKVILRLLKRRLGELPSHLTEQIHALNLTQLDNLAESLLDFQQMDELADWLREHHSN